MRLRIPSVADDPLAEPAAGPPEAEWCPAESDTMHVRLGADVGRIRQRGIVNRLRGWEGFIEFSFIVSIFRLLESLTIRGANNVAPPYLHKLARLVRKSRVKNIQR